MKLLFLEKQALRPAASQAHISFLAGLALFTFAAVGICGQDELRSKAERLHSRYHYKEAYDLFRPLCLDSASTSVVSDISSAMNCLRMLDRLPELDELREAVAAVHSNNWRLLETVAMSFIEYSHYGTVGGGVFIRGSRNAGAEAANAADRDRTRAMQLMLQALPLVVQEGNSEAAGRFYEHFDDIVITHRGTRCSWRLQELSDLASLPGHEPGSGSAVSGISVPAPVDIDGNPVYHHVPTSFDNAKTDGERWRWLMAQAASADTNRADNILFKWATFLEEQFGVATMNQCYWFQQGEWTPTGAPGPFAVETLADDETIARLASGPKRFKLPDEFNYLLLYKQLADNKGLRSEDSIHAIAQEFERRRQLLRAEEWWKRSIAQFGDDNRKAKQRRLNHIVGNWGRFGPTMSGAAGTNAFVTFRFRNATKVRFEAHRINVRQLLFDVRSYIRGRPRELDLDETGLYDIGRHIVSKNHTEYIVGRERTWTVDLEPASNHVDRTVSIDTGLSKAGAYLLTAKVADGTESKVLVWLDDTVIVGKRLDGDRMAYFTLDATTGAPLADQEVVFFGHGWTDSQSPDIWARHVVAKQFVRKTDNLGQILLTADDLRQGTINLTHWLATLQSDEGRLAFVGWGNLWDLDTDDDDTRQARAFAVTDRPVYRPGHEVQFKLWAASARYDTDTPSPFADEQLPVEIRGPKGEKVLEQTYDADAYGGVTCMWTVPTNATLGVYTISCTNIGDAGWFLVEEYKRPEFEVTIKTPDQPLVLGDKFSVQVDAKYYFGAPVASANVRYEVRRTQRTGRWYPVDEWDWLYGAGYWWFAEDRDPSPDWTQPGNPAASTRLWNTQQPAPEVVVQGETKIGPDGKFLFAVDSSVAKVVHGNMDHSYEITVEVTDSSRRAVVGRGVVSAARKAFEVYVWPDRGHYRTGDTIRAAMAARTIDGTPIHGRGVLTLYRVLTDEGKVREKSASVSPLDTDERGMARHELTITQAGQYRLSYSVTDQAGHTIEGGHLFTVIGDDNDANTFMFKPIELVQDKRCYSPGESISLRINSNTPGSTVLLFAKSATNDLIQPRVLHLEGKSMLASVPVTRTDMPNVFIEAVTVRNGLLYNCKKEIAVPPEKRILNVAVTTEKEKYSPGEQANVKVRITDPAGKPCPDSSSVLTVYDRALEYISGGPNAADIRTAFWKWLRQDRLWTETSSCRVFDNITPLNGKTMRDLETLGRFYREDSSHVAGSGGMCSDIGYLFGNYMERVCAIGPSILSRSSGHAYRVPRGSGNPNVSFFNPANDELDKTLAQVMGAPNMTVDTSGLSPVESPAIAPVIRSRFADTAFWTAALQTDSNGEAEVSFKMPDNLTAWQIRTWSVGHGARVGQGTAAAITKKNIIVRLQAPRFFVEKDEVTLSANIHNYLKSAKSVRSILELEGGCLELTDTSSSSRIATVNSNAEHCIDWRVRVLRDGEAVVRLKAITDEESDAVEMRFPVYVHGFMKTESFSGAIRPTASNAVLKIRVPAERRAEQSALEIRYSPTLAGATVDALPYLLDYPYGCTEQTLNRFLPAVIVQKTLRDMGLDLKTIQGKRANLNPQETGDAGSMAARWRGVAGDGSNPVFDDKELANIVKVGVGNLAKMQIDDGGWGWFYGRDERSYPHTTALVVNGLQIAKENGVSLPAGMSERGVTWLRQYQEQQVTLLTNKKYRRPGERDWKHSADDLDALVYAVLVDAGRENSAMRAFLYQDRARLTVYSKTLFAIALHKARRNDELATVTRNIEQFLVEDAENQTAYLKFDNGSCWWRWYGSDIEANASYLKLLARTDPKGTKASGLAKYLLNNRKNGTFWGSTRDTALCVEAMANYLRATGEIKPDMTVEIFVDGRLRKSVKIDAGNLFSFDNRFMLAGSDVSSGEHSIEFRRLGKGPLYFNAYLTSFSVEDYIKKTGLEVRVDRNFFKLIPEEKLVSAAGERGQAVRQKVDHYRREPLVDMTTLKSGDLVEVELVLESKNDYEYLVIEDRKPAGFEPVEANSGYNGNTMDAYVEYRDDRVCFFLRTLARGTHSLSYRTRAEVPGKFSALPAKVYGMYSPELVGNADEIKLKIED